MNNECTEEEANFGKSKWLIEAEQNLSQRDPLDSYHDTLSLLDGQRQRLEMLGFDFGK